jgi:CRISPR-associated endonuclease Cas1
VLTGHGLGLCVEQGTLLVKQGFTHYPQKQDVYRFFRGDRNMPSRITIVDGNGNITLDALGWLAEQNVPLVRIDWQGQVTTVISNNTGPDHRLVRAQLAAQADKKAALRIAASLISAKLKNSIDTLRTLPSSERVEKAIAVHKNGVGELRCSPAKSIGGLLGIEGRSALAYFNAWQGLPLRWKGTGRKPIPADWQKYTSRTSLQSTKPQNRNASHPVNAMLNYAYAVLESRVRLEIVAHGYDPMIGYLHSYDKDRAALVFDLMEPLRPVVDCTVLDLVRSRIFEPADFTIRRDGVCRLNPELAKTLVGQMEKYPFSVNLIVQRSSLPVR